MRKIIGSIVLTTALIGCLCGCGVKARDDQPMKKSVTNAESTTEAPEKATSVSENPAEVPEHFENMEYVIHALMAQQHAKKLSYYGTDTESKDADSFFYSMAVLTSLMQHETGLGDAEDKDGFYYIGENTYAMYASALYASYGTDMEAPEIPEKSEYVTRDDENDLIGFVKGNVSSRVEITSCVKDGKSYKMTASLLDEDGDVEGNYEILLVPSEFEGENNQFYYSVSEFSSTDEGELDFDDDDKNSSGTETPDYDEEDDNDADDIENEETANDYDQNDDAALISQEEALKEAKDEYGDGEYTFDGKETVGNRTYYCFTKKDDDGNKKKILISEDGEDTISGVKNEDGSWSFDQ